MRYISTRGQCPAVEFETAVMTGLAPDGGLYVPERFPTLDPQTLADLRGAPFEQVAFAVLRPFVAGSLSDAELRALVDDAWSAFRLPEVTHLRRLDGVWLLELFHGPTFAFKDVALQLLGRLFDLFLARRERRATVLGATSGDTGSAAISGCRGRDQLNIVILHPHGRTSEIQRRQMTTVADANVTNLAVRGDFDDCQRIVKALFRDADCRQRYGLSAVNSINIARVLAQVVYYVQAALALTETPDARVDFSVPTGNFGDILAGHWARRMGAPVGRLIIATNHNDILARTLQTGRYETHTVAQSLSPSMDIQVSSNFERLLFELADDDAETVRGQMAALADAGSFALSGAALERLRAGFGAGRCDDAQTLAEIRRSFDATGETLDPHTAVGRAVARQHLSEAPMVVLATAHPAKFPSAVSEATGRPTDTPETLQRVMTLPERYEVIDATEQAVRDVLAKL